MGSIYRSLGMRIRQERKAKRMTQEMLSEAADISLSFVGHIERGTRKASIDTLARICNALNVSPDKLLRDSIEAPPACIDTAGIIADALTKIAENIRKGEI